MSDEWKPSASIEVLKQRAQIMQMIRDFFTSRGYWEVDTPYMAHHGITDVYLSNIQSYCYGHTYYLQTSPEYHMKRLLAAGSGAIFQLARVFRDDEHGRWHNPEFTLLEWYQLNVDHHQLLNEVDLFLQQILHTKPCIKMTYQEAFLKQCQLDVDIASIEDLRQLLMRLGLHKVLSQDEQDRDQYLFLLMSHVIEPGLAAEDRPVAIYDFPVSQAALARIKHGVAERFEVYYRGVELANGFHELLDPALQRSRFEQDNLNRQKQGLDPVALDEYFLQALEAGLPACSGVALGIDRLIALALDKISIQECLAFDFSRA